MRQIVAILLLLIYSVCSTGATVYMHQCGKNTSISLLEEDNVSHDSCPMCSNYHQGHQHDNEFDSITSCHDQDNCRDVKVELKTDIEQLQTKLLYGNLVDFSPAVILIPWLSQFWNTLPKSDALKPKPRPLSLLADINPLFLINCTFRI